MGGSFWGWADKRRSMTYGRRMVEKAAGRRAQGLSSSRALQIGVGQEIPAKPGLLRTGAALDVAAAIAGRRPSWAVVAALAIILGLVVATVVLVRRQRGSCRESVSAITIPLPSPPDEALPASS